MALYGIADLHLSFTADKPMDIYGSAWENHTKRLEENWRRTISQEDTVIIAGDISWGLKLDEAIADLEWIHALPGFKVLFKGNHDPWWTSISRLNSLFDDMYFVQNSFYPYGDTAICGTRGWLCPGSSEFTAHDRKIYDREQLRLRASLDAARNAGYEKIIGALHYPPVNDKKEMSAFVEIFNEYGVEQAVYGHLHGETKESMPDMTFGCTTFSLIACDALKCMPQRIL